MWQTTISIIANVILSVALIYLLFIGKVIEWYRNKKKLREKRLETKVQKIVRDYLKQLQND